jgi:RNA polymerase sigma-70 factor, ECF subfamily
VNSNVEDRPGIADGELVARALRGDQIAFEGLVQRYSPLVFRVIRGVLARSAEVEDIAQEVFFRAYRSLGQVETGSRLGPWLARIAVNLCYDHLRRLRRRGERSFSELTREEVRAVDTLLHDETALHAVDRLFLRDVAERLVSRLAPKDRAVLLLKEREGMDTREVAGVLGCSETAVRLRLFRARRTLRKLLGEGAHWTGRDV